MREPWGRRLQLGGWALGITALVALAVIGVVATIARMHLGVRIVQVTSSHPTPRSTVGASASASAPASPSSGQSPSGAFNPDSPLIASRRQLGLGNGVYGNALLIANETSGALLTSYWDGVAWKQVPGQLSGVYRDGMPAYDPVLRKTIMVTGGVTGSPLSTWAWNGTGWSELQAGPYGVSGSALLGFDATSQELLLVVKAATWAFDGTTWRQVGAASPSDRLGTAMAYDPQTKRVVVFGGMSSGEFSPLSDTWTWDRNSWTQQHPAHGPKGGWEALAYDPDTHQLLLMDEHEASPGGAIKLSMWNWDGTDWYELHPATLPPAGYRPTMVYDSANHQLVMALTYAGATQTWIYTGSTWVNRST